MSKDENMKSGDILLLTIKDVRLHKEERMIQGAQYGTYSSNYIAQFVEYPNGIAVVDSIAAIKHPDWERKTEKRAEILTEELSGKKGSGAEVRGWPTRYVNRRSSSYGT